MKDQSVSSRIASLLVQQSADVTNRIGEIAFGRGRL